MTDIYATPKAELEQADFLNYSDKDLKKFSNSWRQLKLVLFIYCVFTFLPTLMFVFFLIALPAEESDGLLIASTLFGIIAAIFISITIGTLKLKPWSRIAGITVSALSLLNIPIGTLLGAVALVSYSRLKQFFVPGGKEKLLALLNERKQRKT